MEKLILERPFTQQVYVLEVKELGPENLFRRYKMQFTLSPSCAVICWLDFGTDNTLRVYEIQGRIRAEALAQLGEFLSHSEWLKEMIDRKMNYW